MNDLIQNEYTSNITFDNNKLIDTLNEIKKSSYSYISEVQKDLVGYHKFDFNMKDFRVDTCNLFDKFTTSKKYSVNIPKQLIPTSHKESYKKSDVFMKELSISDIASRSKLFIYNFIVFINGKIYTNFKIVIMEDMSKLFIYINDGNTNGGFDKSELEDLFDINARVSVYFIPNSIYGQYSTNRYVIDKYSHNIPVDRFDLHGVIGNNSLTYSTSSSTGSGSVISSETGISDVIVVDSALASSLETSIVDIGVVSFSNYDRSINIPAGGDYFELPIRDHIVPLTSFMAFYRENESLYFYHDLNIEYHYPNIYRVIGNTKDIEIKVFYYVPSGNSKFVNEMSLYYRFFGKDVLSKYRNGTIPKQIRDFVPKEYPISIADMIVSGYDNRSLEYKVDNMNNFIDVESRKLGVYLMNMLRDRKKIKLYASTIDLGKKLRTDTSVELPDNVVNFTTPHYVLVFNKYFIHEYDLRFFIDGLFYVCEHKFYDNDYYYFYIPTDIMDSTSIIEIEKHRNISYDFDITLDSIGKEIYIQDNICIASDLIFVDDNGYYIKESDLAVELNENGNNIEVSPTSHKPLGDRFKIKAVAPYLVGKDITVLCRRVSTVYTVDIKTDEDVTKNILSGADISRHQGHYRIYRNGRLLPPDVYDIRFKFKRDSFTVITLNTEKKIGDRYYIEINPNIFYTNYYDNSIDSNGMLDFGGRLNKPFSLKWFDVFLNGYKLNDDNFDIITPRYVLIKNVKTTDHLLIMEKNWSDDVFKFRTSKEDQLPLEFIVNECLDDRLYKSVPELNDIISSIQQSIVIDTSIEALLTDFIIDTSDELMKNTIDVFAHLFNKDLFINPDIDYNRADIPNNITNLIVERGSLVKVFPDIPHMLTTQVIINPDTGIIDPIDIDRQSGVIMH